jgi:hypothetical protein
MRKAGRCQQARTAQDPPRPRTAHLRHQALDERAFLNPFDETAVSADFEETGTYPAGALDFMKAGSGQAFSNSESARRQAAALIVDYLDGHPRMVAGPDQDGRNGISGNPRWPDAKSH